MPQRAHCRQVQHEANDAGKRLRQERFALIARADVCEEEVEPLRFASIQQILCRREQLERKLSTNGKVGNTPS